MLKQDKKIPTIPSNSFQLVESLNESTDANIPLHVQEIELGPGCYNPDLKLTKPRVKGSKFRPEESIKIQNQLTVPQVPLFSQGHQQIDHCEPVKINSPLQQKGYTFAQKGLKKQIGDQKITFNEMFHLGPLRTLTQEDKQKIQKQVHQPEPGQYFNAQTYSVFGGPNRQLKQPFNSKARRFNDKNNKTPGIGDYNVAKYYQITTDNIPQHYAKSLASRFERNYFQMEKQKWPGPGQYQLEEDLVEDKNKFARLAECPPVFGSGSKRFFEANFSQETPGPGSYNLATKQKKKVRRKFRTIVIENTPIDENELRTKSGKGVNKIQVEGIANSDNNNTKIKTPMQSAKEMIADFEMKKGTSPFKSEIKRFPIMQNDEVGPGSYNPKKKFCQKTFNQTPTLFGQVFFTISKRITDHEKKVATATIGPGEYDSNYNSVKQRCFNNIVI